VTLELVQISAGQGPAEVRAFVARLARRIEALCEERGLHVHEVRWAGPEDAPRSVALAVSPGAAAALRGEVGTHALVARSEGRGRAARKRWFAALSIHPSGEDEPGAAAAREVHERDLLVTASRAGGHGGQHVNKVATAVRVVHRPSGIGVRVASERSQRQNLRIAVARIARALAEREEEQRRARSGQLREAHHQVVRGNAVRTYRLAADGGLVLLPPR
jgi:peptide chain release factor 2/peptide chain release factor